jgi:hypothetical protein
LVFLFFFAEKSKQPIEGLATTCFYLKLNRSGLVDVLFIRVIPHSYSI